MNDLEQLREDVRATAPQPRPEFAARLERRVEAGFRTPKPSRAPRRRINLWAPSVAVGCMALIAVVIAIGTSGSMSDDDEDGGGGDVVLHERPAPQDAGGGAGQRAPSPAVTSGEGTNESLAADQSRRALRPGRVRGRGGNRVVEQRTTLELETAADEFTEVTDEVLRVADDTGTIVQRSSVSEQDGRGFARYDLRVPASRLDETLADLSRLAHVTSRTASSQDITRAYVSATDRLDDARAERQSLLKALERADTAVEAEAIRRQIRLVRDRIAAAERDVEALERRADRARVAVTVRSTGRRSEGGAWTPGDALGDAGRILEVAAGVVVVTAAALLPVALLAALAALGARAMRRRRREAALGPR
ncbi:MAG TPA: DUF4349 domain-containing protein [Solirubrobacteraceae bacterium]|nr:DUF4349 domain-containing protein [Solirubrobacteraceae bacterium]